MTYENALTASGKTATPFGQNIKKQGNILSMSLSLTKYFSGLAFTAGLAIASSSYGFAAPDDITADTRSHALNDDNAVTIIAKRGGSSDSARTGRIPPLIQAVQEGDTAQVRALLKAGADPDLYYEYPSTDEVIYTYPVLMAARLNDDLTLGILLAAGADPNRYDGAGFTPMSWAARHGNLFMANDLLLAGAGANAQEHFNHTSPLHMAAREGHTDILRLLIKAGADIDFKNALGDTPLHSAARYGHAEAVKRLVEAGANPAATDGDGRTALEFTEKPAIRRYLEQTISAKQTGAGPLRTKQRPVAMMTM